MRLKKPCIHDCYDRHWPNLFEAVVCPGGEFLPEGALVIEKDADGHWQLPPRGWLVLNAAAAFEVPHGSIGLLNDLADALASQVGESESKISEMPVANQPRKDS